MVWATKVLTARCVRRKVEKDVVAAVVVERDTMAEVVDLRAKVTGAKGAVAVEEEGIKREVKEIIFLTIPHVYVICVRLQDIWLQIVLMQKNLLTLCEREMPMMVEISSEREPNGIRTMTVQTEIMGSTVLCCTPPALTENIHLATLLRWTQLALRTPVIESCLPKETVLDSSRTTSIQTATPGASMQSHAKASNGVMQDALVVDDEKRTKNLVSIPKLDRAGYTTIFSNGRGVVTDRQGNVIADAPLSDNDLYEFDIRELFNTQKAMLGSATLDESDIETWHIRLGHRNTLDLTEAVRKNLVSGPPASVVTSNKRKKSLCDPCVRAKSTKYVKRKRLRPSTLRQSNLNVGNSIEHHDALMDPPDLIAGDDESDGEGVDVPVGRARDIAKAQPIFSNIPIIFTDLKAERKAKCMHKASSKVIQSSSAGTIFRTKAKLWKICETCWKTS